jgi:hypothetical protein
MKNIIFWYPQISKVYLKQGRAATTVEGMDKFTYLKIMDKTDYSNFQRISF